jgi:L-threonylcarbamoyladenylate synthase
MPKRWRTGGAVPLEALVREAAAVVRDGGVIAFPTETLYGLAADAWNPDAVRRVFTIKARDPGQPLPLIAADLDQVVRWIGPLGPTAARLAAGFWPGPLTLVLPAPASLPPEALGGGDRVAVRVSSHAVASGLAREVGRPITATSANRSGEPAPADPDDFARALGELVDGILDAGPSPGGPPSTIVDVCDEPPRLVRAGAVPWDRVVQFRSP